MGEAKDQGMRIAADLFDAYITHNALLLQAMADTIRFLGGRQLADRRQASCLARRMLNQSMHYFLKWHEHPQDPPP